MNTIVSALLLVIAVTGGEALSVDKVVGQISKLLSGECPSAEDLKCPREDISFWLYTRSTQSHGTKLDLNSLKTAPFVDAPLKVLVHGYSDDKDKAINKVLRPKYFDHGDYNLVSVDWSALGRQPCYPQASLSVPTIGRCVAQFLNAMIQARGFSNVHLLGHSMGAHISAWASLEVPGLGRLTEFDPALPLFSDLSSLLKKGKAGFVDVYHSNGGFKGRTSPDGDVDVYFNNGVTQPGCACDTGCSHLRAVEFYAESISNPTKMVALRCTEWHQYDTDQCPLPSETDLAVVGENIDTSKSGSYMMFTNSKEPFLVDPIVYTDQDSFNSYKEKASEVCKNVFEDLINKWIGNIF